MLQRGAVGEIGGLGEEEVREEGEAGCSSKGLGGSTGGRVLKLVEEQAEILMRCVGIDEDGEDLQGTVATAGHYVGATAGGGGG